MTTNQEIILSASNVEVQFTVRGKQLRAIRNISIDLYKDETLAIVGESGSGKSVFTKTFTGMLESNGKVTNGTAMFEGKDLYANKTDADWEAIRGKKIATIFQDPMTSLNPIIPIGNQITEVIEKHHGKSFAEAKEEAIKLMEEVGIYNAEGRFDEYPFMYSGGMRQRIVIAIALACHPDILICDEPTTALDVTIQAQIIRLIKKLQKQYGYTIIFITHDLGVVANVLRVNHYMQFMVLHLACMMKSRVMHLHQEVTMRWKSILKKNHLCLRYQIHITLRHGYWILELQK